MAPPDSQHFVPLWVYQGQPSNGDSWGARLSTPVNLNMFRPSLCLRFWETGIPCKRKHPRPVLTRARFRNQLKLADGEAETILWTPRSPARQRRLPGGAGSRQSVAKSRQVLGRSPEGAEEAPAVTIEILGDMGDSSEYATPHPTLL